MSKAKDEWDAEEAAEEADRAAARQRWMQVFLEPWKAPTSELIMMLASAAIGKALTGGDTVGDTSINADEAMGRLALEIDRRIPVPQIWRRRDDEPVKP